MARNVYVGSWTNFTTEAATNLFLYGELNKPSDIETRIRPSITPEIIVQIDVGSMMANGAPGDYARASQAKFVQSFFAGQIVGITGQKTIAQLKSQYGYSASDFQISIYQHLYDAGGPTHAWRTYVFESQSYNLSDDVVFDFDNNVITNLKIAPVGEDFDFVTGTDRATWFDQWILKTEVDPFLIGKKVDIEYVGATPVLHSIYTKSQFDQDKSFIASAANTIFGTSKSNLSLGAIVNRPGFAGGSFV